MKLTPLQLTPLQQSTAKHIFGVFTRDDNPCKRYLLADEVGLGKTKISADVINELAKNKLAKNKDDRFIVYYICGNERVTIQNKNKLVEDCNAILTKNVRLSMQLNEKYSVKDGKNIIILPLTPAVTFTDKNSEFNQKECKIICVPEEFNRICKLKKQAKEREFKALRTNAISHVIDNHLPPDMVILDEFQNYDGLISDYNSLEPQYVRFTKLMDKARYTLMLSATPFSMKTSDVHNIKYEDLLSKENDDVQSEDVIPSNLETAADSYKNILKFILPKNNTLTIDKLTSDYLYNNVFCRTERSMFYDTNVKNENIEDFKPTTSHAISHINYTNELMEISKSATKCDDAEYASWIKASPHPLAFATRYNGIKKTNDNTANADKSFCKDNALVLAGQHQVDFNKHAGFSLLRDHVLPSGVSDMLWIPPVIFNCPNEYKNKGNPFYKNKDYTKTLVFCTYRMSTASTAYYMCKESEKYSSNSVSSTCSSDNNSTANDKEYYEGIWTGVDEKIKSWIEKEILAPNQAIMEKVTGLTRENAKYRYARMGDLKNVIEEFLFLNDFKNKPVTLLQNIDNATKQQPSKIYFFENEDSYLPDKSSDKKDVDNRKSLGFAERFTNDNGDNNSHSRKHEQNLQFLFNSPFRPFMMSASATAQEGLDFHNYSHCMAHFSMPKTPVEYQQREGRIDRFRSHLMRKRLFMLYSKAENMYELYELANKKSNELYGLANAKTVDKKDTRPLFPNWYIGTGDFDAQLNNSLQLPKFKRLIYAIPVSQEDTYYRKLELAISSYQAYLGESFDNNKASFCPFLRE